jgi:phosphoserine phosphatase
MAEASSSEPVLCVDLDGTLVRGDCMVYCARLLLYRRPWYALGMAVWHWRGRAALKDHIARRVAFDPASLAYHRELLSWLGQEKTKGRRLVLASGSDRRIVAAVARHLGLFDDALGSDGRINLTGPRKEAALSARYRTYDYVGNSQDDVPVWRRAGMSYLVAGSARLAARLEREIRFARVFPADWAK